MDSHSSVRLLIPDSTFAEEYEMYMKKMEVTTVTTAVVQEPQVGDAAEFEMMMQKKTQTMTFVTGQVSGFSTTH